MGKYQSLEELYENVSSKDYRIIYEKNESLVSILAIHGGQIEEGTSEIAKILATMGEYQYFIFEGLRNKNNSELHVTSSKFQDKNLFKLLNKTLITVSIHGADEEDSLTYVGGLNEDLKNLIIEEFNKNGFKTPKIIRDGLKGISKLNVCNRNLISSGVQLELSQGLRKELFGDNWKNKDYRNKLVYNNKILLYCKCIYNSIENYLNLMKEIKDV